MSWFKRLFTRQPHIVKRQNTHDDPLVITSPRLGIWNILGPPALPLINEDRVALTPLFASVSESEEAPSVCDVLLIYCRLEPDGRIDGSPASLREAIWKAQACIAIVATESSVENYIAASKRPGLGQANLVMTLARKGQVFPVFFHNLFSAMKSGKTMPTAWVELAPQMPGRQHVDCPETIMACEAGHITFGQRAI